MAGVDGFEPPMLDSKSRVFPLDDTPVFIFIIPHHICICAANYLFPSQEHSKFHNISQVP